MGIAGPVRGNEARLKSLYRNRTGSLGIVEYVSSAEGSDGNVIRLCLSSHPQQFLRTLSHYCDTGACRSSTLLWPYHATSRKLRTRDVLPDDTVGAWEETLNDMTLFHSVGLDPARETAHLGQQGATSAVLDFCRDTLAALEQYSAILLDERDICSVSAEERAALKSLEARVKLPCPHRSQTPVDLHAKSVVYHELAEWFPPHDLDVYASNLIGEVSALLEREHLDSGLAARVSRAVPPYKNSATR